MGFHSGYKIEFENKKKNRNKTNPLTTDHPLSDTFHISLCPFSAVWLNSEILNLTVGGKDSYHWLLWGFDCYVMTEQC